MFEHFFLPTYLLFIQFCVFKFVCVCARACISVSVCICVSRAFVICSCLSACFVLFWFVCFLKGKNRCGWMDVMVGRIWERGDFDQYVLYEKN